MFEMVAVSRHRAAGIKAWQSGCSLAFIGGGGRDTANRPCLSSLLVFFCVGGIAELANQTVLTDHGADRFGSLSRILVSAFYELLVDNQCCLIGFSLRILADAEKSRTRPRFTLHLLQPDFCARSKTWSERDLR